MRSGGPSDSISIGRKMSGPVPFREKPKGYLRMRRDGMLLERLLYAVEYGTAGFPRTKTDRPETIF
jgi:hypothetical protein